MKDEIKEILISNIKNEIKKTKEKDFTLCIEQWEQLLDYITNLQERCEYLERSNNRREDEIISLRDENVAVETYKSRIDKAIETINKQLMSNTNLTHYTDEMCLNDLLKALRGEDNDKS